MQWFGKHATTIETVFSAWSVARSYPEDNRRYKADEGSVVERATEAEKSPLLTFVTRKRLVKTLQMNSLCGELLPHKDK
jgi:hypothetical protein